MTDIAQPDQSGDANRHSERFPAALPRDGIRQAIAAAQRIERGDEGAESDARSALHTIVDAFLTDRRANAEMFTYAHHVGAYLSTTVGCPWTVNDEQYTLRCPVWALHQPFAVSPTFVRTSICSICGAEPFACLHIPGETYDGQQCDMETTSLRFGDHMALTANPDFIGNWHRQDSVPASELIAEGKIKKAGDIVYCNHCQECAGEPTEGDLDPVKRLKEAADKANADGHRPASTSTSYPILRAHG